MSSKEGFAMT